MASIAVSGCTTDEPRGRVRFNIYYIMVRHKSTLGQMKKNASLLFCDKEIIIFECASGRLLIINRFHNETFDTQATHSRLMSVEGSPFNRHLSP